MHINLDPVLLLLFLLMSSSLGKDPLYIGGFFPMQDGAWDGSGILPAAQMAIEDVNAYPHILPDHQLYMVWNNSKCNVGESMKSLFYQLDTVPQLHIILGAGCSSVTKVIAETVKHWNLVQVSHSSSSPDLDDRGKYPYLFRTYPSESVTNPPKIALMKQFGWSRVALLQTNDGSFDAIMSNLYTQLLDEGMVITASEKFGNDPRAALMNINDKDARVIIAAFFPDRGQEVFCLAYQLGMTGPTYTWILPGWFEDNWWETNSTSCHVTELRKAVQYHIATEVVSLADNDSVTDVVKTPKQFTEEYNNRTASGTYGGTSYATSGYDSVWVIAYALNKTNEALRQQGSSLSSFTYSSDDIRGLIFSFVNETNITGVSGLIQYNSNGMRLGITRVKQYKGNRYVNILKYDTNTGHFTSEGDVFEWKTTNGDPPSDGPVLTEELEGVNKPLFYIVNILASAGIVFNLFLLTFNIVYRKRRTLKMSSPNINYLICSGTLLIYISTLLFGFDTEKNLDELKSQKVVSSICMVTCWVLTIGFTSSFGAIIAKAWRIRRLMSTTKMKKQNIKDWHLFIAIGILALLDLIILIPWSALDPVKIEVFPLDRKRVGEDEFVTPYDSRCDSESDVWLIVIYVYKGLLLLYGALVAWEQRNIKMTLLNEGKPIALTIYTVTVLCIIAVPVSFVLETKTDFVYGICSFCIIFGTTIMLGFCFIPKVQIVLKNSVAAENVLIANMTSSDKKKDSTVDSEFALKCKIAQLETKITSQDGDISRLKLLIQSMDSKDA